MDSDDVFQSVEKPRLSSEVARQIAQAIREGRILPGQRLAPERELTIRFGISRPILREALRMLEIQGLITIRHGRGAFVKDPDTDILNIPLAQWLAQNRQQVQQFYEARLAIEPACAALAGQRATPEQIAALKEIVAQASQVAKEDHIATFVGLDIDFHSAIARMSGNALLYRMLSSLIVPETDARKIVLRLPSHLPDAQAGHDAILAAIEKRDPEAARQAMVDALTKPLQVIQQFLEAQEASS